MAGCGYVCPLCEGSGITTEGKVCDYCKEKPEASKQKAEDREAWIKNVHEGPCCGDSNEE